MLYIIYDVAEGLAEGCGGTVSHSELDKFSAQFSMLIFIPVFVKVAMNIVDFVTYKKDKRNAQKLVEDLEIYENSRVIKIKNNIGFFFIIYHQLYYIINHLKNMLLL